MAKFEDDLNNAIGELANLSPNDGLWQQLDQQLDFDMTVNIKAQELPVLMPNEDLWMTIEKKLHAKRRLAPIWWKGAAVLVLVSGIVLWFAQNQIVNERVTIQSNQDPKPLLEKKEELKPSANHVVVQENIQRGNKALTDVANEQSQILKRATIELQRVEARPTTFLIKKPSVSDLEMQTVEIKEPSQRSHYREVDIVFKPTRKGGRGKTQLDILVEKKYQQKIEQGQRLFIEPLLAISASNELNIENEKHKTARLK